MDTSVNLDTINEARFSIMQSKTELAYIFAGSCYDPYQELVNILDKFYEFDKLNKRYLSIKYRILQYNGDHTALVKILTSLLIGCDVDINAF